MKLKLKLNLKQRNHKKNKNSLTFHLSELFFVLLVVATILLSNMINVKVRVQENILKACGVKVIYIL